MAQPLEATFPQFLNLADGYVLRFDAVDPATGAHVAGVTVQDASLYGASLDTYTGEVGVEGPFMLVPGPGA